MSQTNQTSDAIVHPIIGELSEFTRNMPMDDEEQATLFKMIRSATSAIDNKNMRAIALLAVGKTEKNLNSTLSPDDLQEEASAQMLIIMRYLKAVRDDITNDVLYDPHGQLWLLESNFNDHVARLIMKALQDMAHNERALLNSGTFPNRDLLDGTVEMAINARDNYLDLSGRIFGGRFAPPTGIDADSSCFSMADEEVQELICAIVEDHKIEHEEWSDCIKMFVQNAFWLPLDDLTARQYHLVKRAIGKARLSRERRMNEDGSELSLWTVGEERSADDFETSLKSTQGLINNYYEDAKNELAEELRKEIADRNGVSTHELSIEGAGRQRRR